ncbi:hypothetical protein Nepgr_026951 [Nepenthes gracilis]|uniref:U-box domain-containing protein n=1 Tax=Nepenthes gracilis TaxID=150966 RepID=A0AAD3Y118_NEPGR|nr:hypothetical protein Nepgr_026951 [Nepenthes gracilis]
MKEARKMWVPELFRCPISLDLFTEPVTLCTGQTYDRPFIQKWLSAGNLTCPVTMLKLQDLSMVPNHTLHHFIHQWLQTGQQFYPEHDYPNGSDIGIHLAELKHTLESKNSTSDQKLQALKKIRLLSEDLPDRKEDLNRSGIFQLLIEMGFGGEGKSSHEILEFVEEVLCVAIRLIPFSNLGCLDYVINEKPKLASFVFLLEEGTAMIKLCLCQLVEAMAFSSSIETNEVPIIRAIISLLNHEHHDFELSGAGVRALSALCLARSSLENLIKEGAVDSLIAYISRAEGTKNSRAGKATMAIERLLGEEMGKESLMRNSNGVRALVKMVFRVSDHEGSESAVNGLMILCCESKEAREEAVSGGVLTQLLLLLQSQCCLRIKTRARMLLKLLGSMWPKDPKHV